MSRALAILILLGLLWPGPATAETRPPIPRDRPSLSAPAGPVVGDHLWSDEFGLPICDGSIAAAVRYGDDLIVCGSFHQIGGVAAENIARWDGAAWHPLGSGIDRWATAMVVYQGRVFVAGLFQWVNGVFSPHLAAWDGKAWSAIGTFSSPYLCCYGITALAVYQGDLVAAGDYPYSSPVRGLARWDGSRWSLFGQGVQGTVQCLAVHGDSLYVGGYFTEAGSDTALNVAVWDGSRWSHLGSGLSGSGVRALALYRDHLIAGGDFYDSNYEGYHSVAEWDGSTWSSISTSGGVQSMVVHDDRLTVASYYVQSWDGNAWTYDYSAWGSLLYADGADLLVMGGGARHVGTGEIAGLGIVRWDGNDWSGFEPWTRRMHGLASSYWIGSVDCLASFQGDLVAGGSIGVAGTGQGWQDVGPINRWDGTAWTRMPFEWFQGGNPTALLAETDTLYAAGSFSSYENGYPRTGGLMRWAENHWALLDSAFFGATCIVRYDGELVVGTQGFSESMPGGVYAWNGERWRVLGITTGEGVRSLAVHDGRLVAAGLYQSIGNAIANGIAAWNGTEWTPMDGPGTPRYPTGVAEFRGHLYVTSWSSPLRRWEGSSWKTIEGLSGGGDCMGIAGGNLYLGGSFSLSKDAFTMVMWNGFTWSPLGSGTNGYVHAFQEHDGALFVGGNFSMAGSKSSFAVARWNGVGPARGAPKARLSSPYPNPFFLTGTDLSFDLPEAGFVRVAVYDARGREIIVLRDEDWMSGKVLLHWDGRDSAGQHVASGIYFVKASDSHGNTASRKVVRLK